MTGLANCWSTRLLPGDQKDTGIKVRFTVQDSSKAARQMPGGCVRWGFHYGENLPGWDFGVVLGYQDPLNFYRVQVSAARGEMALWDANGGFLQIVPCAVAVGKPAQTEHHLARGAPYRSAGRQSRNRLLGSHTAVCQRADRTDGLEEQSAGRAV